MNCWWEDETLKKQPNNLLNLKMCSHIFKIKIKFYLMPSLSMVLGGLVKRLIVLKDQLLSPIQVISCALRSENACYSD